MIIAKVSEVPEGAQKLFEHQGKPAILFQFKGQFRAYINICAHAGGPTDLAGQELVCEWHGSHYNPLTGEATKGPAPLGSKLAPLPIKVEGDAIYLSE